MLHVLVLNLLQQHCLLILEDVKFRHYFISLQIRSFLLGLALTSVLQMLLHELLLVLNEFIEAILVFC